MTDYAVMDRWFARTVAVLTILALVCVWGMALIGGDVSWTFAWGSMLMFVCTPLALWKGVVFCRLCTSIQKRQEALCSTHYAVLCQFFNEEGKTLKHLPWKSWLVRCFVGATSTEQKAPPLKFRLSMFLLLALGRNILFALLFLLVVGGIGVGLCMLGLGAEIVFIRVAEQLKLLVNYGLVRPGLATAFLSARILACSAVLIWIDYLFFTGAIQRAHNKINPVYCIGGFDEVPLEETS